MRAVVINKDSLLYKRVSVVSGFLCTANRFFFTIVGPYGKLCYFVGLVRTRTGVYSWNKSLLKSFVTLFLNNIQGLTSLHYTFLQMVGVGYKSYIPRRRNYDALILKVGFSGVDLGYRLPDSIRGRARKNRFVLVGVDKSVLFTNIRQIINLKVPGAYTGKGIRFRGQEIVLKKTKQQQRNK
jgi:ribosomal protein L6P/L9E